MKAFPTNIKVATGGDGWRTEHGMDLRDYFAAKAIPTAFAMAKHDFDRELTEGYSFGNLEDYEEVAARAYALADAMMEARENKDVNY
jgi:hypothetical protein